MERARAISTGAFEVVVSGSVEERLRSWCWAADLFCSEVYSTSSSVSLVSSLS